MNKIIIFKQATGCRPCDTLKMVLEQDLEVQADLTVDLLSGRVTDAEGNITENDGYAMAGQYGIMATPVTILVDGEGNVIEDVRGLPQRDVLIEMFKQRG